MTLDHRVVPHLTDGTSSQHAHTHTKLVCVTRLILETNWAIYVTVDGPWLPCPFSFSFFFMYCVCVCVCCPFYYSSGPFERTYKDIGHVDDDTSLIVWKRAIDVALMCVYRKEEGKNYGRGVRIEFDRGGKQSHLTEGFPPFSELRKPPPSAFNSRGIAPLPPETRYYI